MKRLLAVGLAVAGMVILNAFASTGVRRSEGSSSNAAEVISSWYWLQGYGAWLAKDEQRLLDDYRFATGLNPNHLDYWRLASQTLAFDVPTWSPERDRTEQGKEALEFFERSRSYFATNPDWFQTGAFLAETAAGDPERSLQYLKEGIALDGFPYLLGRSYVRLLLETDQPSTALAFLKDWQTQLEGEVYPERHQEVADWILSLEKQLTTTHSK